MSQSATSYAATAKAKVMGGTSSAAAPPSSAE